MVELRKQKLALGRYVLGKTIGEGTFGKVKIGTHLPTRQKVAVKVLERARIKEVADVERVARELFILKIVRHSHIIQLHEIVETSEQLFLIMEYCSGGELFDHIVEKGRLSEVEACEIFHQIVSGVEQIHKAGVVHRDLKPENMLLDHSGGRTIIKICDFGLGNIFSEGQLLKTACGSPCYAAPEMIADKWYVPPGVDVWSCGVIVFALVCGYLPFEDRSHGELYRKILHAEFKIPKFVSEDARNLINAILTIDPEQRATFADIREHPWYLQIPDAAESWTDEVAVQPQNALLKELSGMGYSEGYVRRCLAESKHNAATTAYHLLAEKRQSSDASDESTSDDEVTASDDDWESTSDAADDAAAGQGALGRSGGKTNHGSRWQPKESDEVTTGSKAAKAAVTARNPAGKGAVSRGKKGNDGRHSANGNRKGAWAANDVGYDDDQAWWYGHNDLTWSQKPGTSTSRKQAWPSKSGDDGWYSNDRQWNDAGAWASSSKPHAEAWHAAEKGGWSAGATSSTAWHRDTSNWYREANGRGYKDVTQRSSARQGDNSAWYGGTQGHESTTSAAHSSARHYDNSAWHGDTQGRGAAVSSTARQYDNSDWYGDASAWYGDADWRGSSARDSHNMARQHDNSAWYGSANGPSSGGGGRSWRTDASAARTGQSAYAGQHWKAGGK